MKIIIITFLSTTFFHFSLDLSSMYVDLLRVDCISAFHWGVGGRCVLSKYKWGSRGDTIDRRFKWPQEWQGCVSNVQK